MKSQTGEILTDQKCINDTFHCFYCDLYSSNSKCEPTSYTYFLSTLNLPHLSESDSESLARPLSLIELESSIKVMSKGKSPGLDGIPVEFYLTFWSDLGPLMLDMMQYSIDQGSFPQNMNMAIIALLLKKDKDSTLYSSYRPLSLIGTDVNLCKSFSLPLRRLYD